MRAVNLIPAEQRSGQPVGAGRSQGGAYAVLLLIGGLAVLAYAYGSADRQAASRRTQVASLEAQAQRAQATAERLAPYTSFLAERETRVNAVESLIDSRFDWAHVFHEFGRVLPKGVSVSSLSGAVGASGGTSTASAASTASATSSASAGSSAAGAGSVTSATPPGSVPTFTLSGCATSQPTVALTLQRLRLIDGVKEVTLQSSTGGPVGSAASASASAGGSGCPSGDPVFSVQIAFDPLPSTAAVAAAAKTVSEKGSAGSTASATATSGAGGR